MNSDKFATEHILEFQLLTIFLESLASPAKNFPNPTGGANVNYCTWLKGFWTPTGTQGRITVNNKPRTPLQHVAYQFPGSDSDYNSEFVLLESGVNTAKEGVSSSDETNILKSFLILTMGSQMWGKSASINLDQTMTDYEQQQPDRAVKNLKDVLSAINYHRIPAVSSTLVRQANRVGTMFDQMEDALVARGGGYQKVNLQQKWNSWIKGRADRARTRAETHLNDNYEKLKAGYLSDYQQQPQFSDGVLVKKIQELGKAIANAQSWSNPFP